MNLQQSINDRDDEPVYVGEPGYSGRVEVFQCGLCNGWGRHEFGRCVPCKGTGLLCRPTCWHCANTRGGVPGNEHWADGELMCDYCSADRMQPCLIK